MSTRYLINAIIKVIDLVIQYLNLLKKSKLVFTRWICEFVVKNWAMNGVCIDQKLLNIYQHNATNISEL